MGKGKALIACCCIITIALFVTMLILMQDVNPAPLSLDELESKDEEFIDDHSIITDLPDRPNFEIARITPFPSFVLRNTTTESPQSLLKYTVKRIVPPIWSAVKQVENVPQFKAVYKKEIIDTNDTTTNNTHVKRSVDDVRKLGSDLNSLVLKIIDDSGRLNIEIKISSNDAFAIQEKQSKTSENKTELKDQFKYNMTVKSNSNGNFELKDQSKYNMTVKSNSNGNFELKDQSKYNMTVKSNSDGNFSVSKLEKNATTGLLPNKSVTVDKHSVNLIAENKQKHDVLQVSAQKNISANIVDVTTTSTTECCIKGNKSTVMVPNKIKYQAIKSIAKQL